MFKNVPAFVASAAILLGAASGPAAAADLFGRDYRGSVKDAPEYAFSWTGVYVGGHAGLAVGDASGNIAGTPITVDVDMNGAIYGGQVGFNYQTGNTVIGIEGTFSGASLDGNSTCIIGPLNCQAEVDWTATVVGKLGYAFNRSMIYAVGGVAWAEINSDVDIIGIPLASASQTHTGWVAGLGIERALSDRVSAKIEYNHLEFGSETHLLGGVVPVKVDASSDVIKLGINIKLTN